MDASKGKILVCDDQPINIKLLQRKLEREGYEVLTAFNGLEALALARTVEPDLVLLDVMMPVMNGIETCVEMKQDEITKDIPVIFVTAKASKEGKLDGLEAGAVDYITKPIDLEETLVRVRTQLCVRRMERENTRLRELAAFCQKTLNEAGDSLPPEALRTLVKELDAALGIASEDEAPEEALEPPSMSEAERTKRKLKEVMDLLAKAYAEKVSLMTQLNSLGEENRRLEASVKRMSKKKRDWSLFFWRKRKP